MQDGQHFENLQIAKFLFLVIGANFSKHLQHLALYHNMLGRFSLVWFCIASVADAHFAAPCECREWHNGREIRVWNSGNSDLKEQYDLDVIVCRKGDFCTDLQRCIDYDDLDEYLRQRDVEAVQMPQSPQNLKQAHTASKSKEAIDPEEEKGGYSFLTVLLLSVLLILVVGSTVALAVHCMSKGKSSQYELVHDKP